MALPWRLHVTIDPGGRTAHFYVTCAAWHEEDLPQEALASLTLGDGRTLDLGPLSAPTAFTWHAQHTMEVATYVYPSAGPYRAELTWGQERAHVTVGATVLEPAAPSPLPEITFLQVAPLADSPLEAKVQLAVGRWPADIEIRVDGGAGQVEHWSPSETPATMEWTLAYPKPGAYTVAVDLVDEEGFWLATLAEAAVEIAEPVADLSAPPIELSVAPAAEPETRAAEAATALTEVSAASLPPWIPFRYARPLWSWARTYRQPGGGTVARVLQPGTYLAIRDETIAAGALWYQVALGDWIPASAVALLTPSELRGVELDGSQPPPPPPPPSPPPGRSGVVTATVLNVRARPGTQPDNPPIDRLTQGTVVAIYEQADVEGAVWYRIGEGRWAHGGWIRLIDGAPPARRGVVTATALNVRARPGTQPDNPPIDRLRAGTEVSILEETQAEGDPWYRIGEGRWVSGRWVRLLRGTPSANDALAKSLGMEAWTLPVGWVIASSLHVRARPGTDAGNPPIGEVVHNQPLPIYESRRVDNATWYRIGDNRWVHGGWVGVARVRSRPSAIGSTERWVGVNLREQTAVAYEGDRPVYAALVATGLPGTPTVQGVFRTWLRVRSRKMSGGRPGMYYYLEEVPWTCYFYSGYALHAAYWHDAFGRPRSHGCVNFSLYDSWWIFQWSETGGARSPVVYVYS